MAKRTRHKTANTFFYTDTMSEGVELGPKIVNACADQGLDVEFSRSPSGVYAFRSATVVEIPWPSVDKVKTDWGMKRLSSRLIQPSLYREWRAVA